MNNFAHIVKQNIIDSQTDPHTHTHTDRSTDRHTDKDRKISSDGQTDKYREDLFCSIWEIEREEREEIYEETEAQREERK